MKKAGLLRERKNITILSGIACFFLYMVMLSGCGLDVYNVVLEAPYSDGHTAYYSSDDYTSNYFSFCTYESSPNVSSSTFKFKGTAIYYKIFNNYSTMVSYQSAVSTLNTDSNYTSAVDLLLDTQHYKQIKISKGSITPLIKAAGDNRYVYLRLTSYGTSTEYQQGICLDTDNAMTTYMETKAGDANPPVALTYDGEAVSPRRYVNSLYTFNFGGSNSETDVVPSSTDDDVCWSETTTENGTWYVDMYAVSVGLETDTWTTSYSQLLHIGSVTIVEGEDN